MSKDVSLLMFLMICFFIIPTVLQHLPILWMIRSVFTALWGSPQWQQESSWATPPDLILPHQFIPTPSGWRYYASLRKTDRRWNASVPSATEPLDSGGQLWMQSRQTKGLSVCLFLWMCFMWYVLLLWVKIQIQRPGSFDSPSPDGQNFRRADLMYLHSDSSLFGHGLVHPDEGHVVVQVVDGALRRKGRERWKTQKRTKEREAE